VNCLPAFSFKTLSCISWVCADGEDSKILSEEGIDPASAGGLD